MIQMLSVYLFSWMTKLVKKIVIIVINTIIIIIININNY